MQNSSYSGSSVIITCVVLWYIVTSRRVVQSGQLVYAVAHNVITLEGQSVNLQCLTYPSDTALTWTFDGLELPAQERYALTELNHTLTISASTIKDGGIYGCHIAGTHINDSITLIVKSGASITACFD